MKPHIFKRGGIWWARVSFYHYFPTYEFGRLTFRELIAANIPWGSK